jgi:hypothetical protein
MFLTDEPPFILSLSWLAIVLPQGLEVGEAEFTTPEGLVHQVIGFDCN